MFEPKKLREKIELIKNERLSKRVIKGDHTDDLLGICEALIEHVEQISKDLYGSMEAKEFAKSEYFSAIYKQEIANLKKRP